MRKVEHFIDLEVFERAKADGILVNLFEEIRGYCFQLLVQPELSHGRQRIEFTVNEMTWQDAWWRGSWWFRFLAWLYGKTPTRVKWRWPRILRYLNDAKVPVGTFRHVHLDNSDDIQARIIVMIEELRRRGEQPSMALLAEGDFFKMGRQWGHEYRYGPMLYGLQIFGLKVKMSPFLADGCVIVA